MNDKEDYYPRLIDQTIDQYADIFGAVYLTGPKACGKTTTCDHRSKTIYRLSNETERRQVSSLIYSSSPSILFDVDKPILFDEWQEFPELWDLTRSYIDEENATGEIFLTGSRDLSKKEKEKIHHSGSGRIATLPMRPMSLYESKESTGEISLHELTEPDFRITRNIKSNLSLEDLIFLSSRGGWPRAVTSKNKEASLLVAKNIIDSFCSSTFGEEEETDDLGRFDENLMRRLLYSYARNDSTLASNKKIVKDAIKNGELSLSEATFYRYRNKLEKHYIIEDVPSWSPLFKSRANLNSLPKKEFVDPSLAIASARLSPAYLRSNLFDFGFFYENLCIRDLRIYAEAHGGRLYYYRDRNGLEADAVIVYGDNRYLLAEIKLGLNGHEEAERHLLKIKSLIDTYNKEKLEEGKNDMIMPLPSGLAIVTGHNQALTLASGVHVVPIGCLKD